METKLTIIIPLFLFGLIDVIYIENRYKICYNLIKCLCIHAFIPDFMSFVPLKQNSHYFVILYQ